MTTNKVLIMIILFSCIMISLTPVESAYGEVCRDTYHDRFECDGIIVHCAVWCDEIPDCDDGFDEAHCLPPEPDACTGDDCKTDDGDTNAGDATVLTRVTKWLAGIFGCVCLATVLAVLYFKRDNLRALNFRGERTLYPSNTDIELGESPAAPEEYSEKYREESEVPLETNHAT